MCTARNQSSTEGRHPVRKIKIEIILFFQSVTLVKTKQRSNLSNITLNPSVHVSENIDTVPQCGISAVLIT